MLQHSLISKVNERNLISNYNTEERDFKHYLIYNLLITKCTMDSWKFYFLNFEIFVRQLLNSFKSRFSENKISVGQIKL